MTNFILIILASIISLLNSAPTSTVYTYKTVNNIKIDAIVFSPAYIPGQLSPVLMAIHGGAYAVGSKTSKSIQLNEIEEAISRGWTVVSIDYRLTPAVLLEDIFEDVQDAYHWIRNELWKLQPINKDLISIFGSSAGGALALIAGYKLNPRPKALIIFYPFAPNFNHPDMNDMTTKPSAKLLQSIQTLGAQTLTEYTYEFGVYDPRPYLFADLIHEKKVGWSLVSRNPDESAESIFKKLSAFSAVDNIDKDYPPTYLGHGMSDKIVVFSQSIELAHKLEEHGVEFVLDLLPSFGHGYDADGAYGENAWKSHILPAFDLVAKFMKE